MEKKVMGMARGLATAATKLSLMNALCGRCKQMLIMTVRTLRGTPQQIMPKIREKLCDNCKQKLYGEMKKHV